MGGPNFTIFEKCAFQALFDPFKCLRCILFEAQSVLGTVIIRFVPKFVTNIAKKLNKLEFTERIDILTLFFMFWSQYLDDFPKIPCSFYIV